MIEHCHCGRILPHDKTAECEKPRVRTVEEVAAAMNTPVQCGPERPVDKSGQSVNGGEKP